jgi:uncharacterized protein (DUF1697 family)
MGVSVALLRGINVGGSHKLPMADLRAVFADAGHRDVTTYIQSGNVVFTHAGRSAVALQKDLEQRIAAATGFAVPVVLRTARELAAVVAANPFPRATPTTLHVVFLGAAPEPGAMNGIDADAFAPERFARRGRDLYLHLPDGMGRAALPRALDRVAPGTARNWRTVTTLAEMAAG